MRCHVRFTHWPLTWEAWVDEHFGTGTWAHLRKRALVTDPPDWKEAAVRWATLDGEKE